MGQENLPWDLVEGKTRADDPRFWPGGAQLSGETFENALIVDVDITAAELIGATFKNCTLARLDLRDGFMSEATFENCIFYKCDLRRADLTNATLKDVTIDRSNLCSAKFTGVQTENFRLMRSEASPCDFRKSKLAGFFSYCDLSAVNFDGADIQNLELFRCNIKFSRVDAFKHECTTTGIEAAERAGDFQVPWFLASATRFEEIPDEDSIEGGYFYGRDLTGLNLKGKKLRNVNFLRTTLAKADFSETVLDNVWLWDCDVDCLNLNKADAKRLSMSHVRGTIQAQGANFDVWNVYDSELAESNFEGCEIQAGTFSMSMFPNSNFSKIDLFVVESFMTDFTGCNFTGTDLSTQASERSYFDDGINSLPMSQSPLKHVAEAGDINFFYLPISDDKSSTRQKKSSDPTEKEPFQALKDSAPFKGVDETDKPESKIPVAIPSSAPAAGGGLNLAPVEEPISDLPLSQAEPKKSEATRTREISKPFDAVEDSDEHKIPSERAKTAEQKSVEPVARPTLDLSDAPHIKNAREKQESEKSKPEIKPEPVASKPEPVASKPEPVKIEPAKPEPAKVEPAKPEPAKVEPAKVEPKKEAKPKPSISSSASALKSDKAKPSSTSTGGGLRSKLSAAASSPSSSLSNKLSGVGPALKKPASSGLSSNNRGASFGSGSNTGPNPVPSSPSGPTPTLSSPAKPAGFGGQQNSAPSPLGGSAAPSAFNSGPPTGSGPVASGGFGATTAPPTDAAPSHTDAPAPQMDAPQSGPQATSPQAAPSTQEPGSVSPLDTQVPTEAPASSTRAPQEPEPVAAQKPAETKVEKAPKEAHSTDLIHHEEPQLGFFARIINWFKSLFGK